MRTRAEARAAKKRDVERDLKQFQIEIPNDPVNEQVLLSAMAADADARRRLAKAFTPDHFFVERHRAVFAGFAAFILLGTLALMLPAAAADGRSTDFVTALFASIDDTGYTDSRGLFELREAIAANLAARFGRSVPVERVLVTLGTSSAMTLVFACLVEPGDEVLIADPSYPCNRQIVESFGARVSLVPTTAETRFQLDAASVRSHWTDRTRGIMIATPSNPTGTSVPADELGAICGLAREREAWRIVDEIYLSLADHDAQDMVREIKASPLLFGYRGTEEVDVAALAEAAYRLPALVGRQHFFCTISWSLCWSRASSATRRLRRAFAASSSWSHLAASALRAPYWLR